MPIFVVGTDTCFITELSPQPWSDLYRYNLAKHTFIFKSPSWLPWSALQNSRGIQHSSCCCVVVLVVFLLLSMRVICLPGLIRLIWLGKQCPIPPSLLHVCPSRSCMPGQRGWPSLNRGGPVFSQGYRSSYAPMLEPPNKLSKNTKFVMLSMAFFD